MSQTLSGINKELLDRSFGTDLPAKIEFLSNFLGSYKENLVKMEKAIDDPYTQKWYDAAHTMREITARIAAFRLTYLLEEAYRNMGYSSEKKRELLAEIEAESKVVAEDSKKEIELLKLNSTLSVKTGDASRSSKKAPSGIDKAILDRNFVDERTKMEFFTTVLEDYEGILKKMEKVINSSSTLEWYDTAHNAREIFSYIGALRLIELFEEAYKNMGYTPAKKRELMKEIRRESKPVLGFMAREAADYRKINNR